MIVSMYDNINPVSVEAATFLRTFYTYFIKISVSVIPNNRSETERNCLKTRSCGTPEKIKIVVVNSETIHTHKTCLIY